MAVTSAKAIESEERTKRVVDMRRLGMTLDQIGGRLGISRQAVHKVLLRAYRRVHAQTVMDAKALIAQELDRLDEYQRTAELIRLKGSTEEIRLKAVDRLIAIGKRRALLTGIESPPPAAPSVTVNVVTPREAAAVRMAPFLAGATLEEKVKLLELIETAEARQDAARAIEAATGPTAALTFRDAADATPAPPAGQPPRYLHTPGHHADER